MTFDEAIRKSLSFRDERNWLQFHNPKDLALSLTLEAAELLECFQWSGTDLVVSEKRDCIAEELADVMNYCILLSDVLGIDLLQALSDKIDKNALKYPVDKAKDSAKKYTEL